jgi:hypothetical protein
MSRDAIVSGEIRRWVEATASLAAEIERDAEVTQPVKHMAHALHQAAIFVELVAAGMHVHVHIGGKVIVSPREEMQRG